MPETNPLDLRSSDDVLADATTCAALVALLEPSWQDPEKLLRSELGKTPQVLLATDDDGQLVAFSTWRTETLRVDGMAVAAVYIGLSSVAQTSKGKGLGRRVVLGSMKLGYEEALVLHRTLADPHPCSPLAWGVTSSPVSYQGLVRAFPDFEPKGTTVSAEVRAMFASLAEAVGSGTPDPDRPYLLRGATTARYTPGEADRLDQALQAKPTALFDTLDSTHGDRLLMVLRHGARPV